MKRRFVVINLRCARKTVLLVMIIMLLLTLGFLFSVHNDHTNRRAHGKDVGREKPSTIPSFITRDCLTNQTIRHFTGPYIVNTGLDTTKLAPSETHEERKQSFEKIFKFRIWKAQKVPGYGDIQASGHGSTLESTKTVVAALEAVIEFVKKELGKKVIRLLDIPCGDMVWMNRFLRSRSDIEYVGIDIVSAIINKHKVRYRNMTNWSFWQHDIVKSSLPGRFDLILSRHMMQHLQLEDVMKVLHHLSSAGSFLIMTDYPQLDKNILLDITKSDRCRYLNLSLRPYKLAPPLCIVHDAKASWLSLHQLPLRQLQQCKVTHFEYLNQKFLSCA